MKKTNKLWLALLLTVLVAALLAVGFTAAAVETPAILAQGYCGGEGDRTNLTWVLTDDCTLTISGTGAMVDFRWDQQPWSEYNSAYHNAYNNPVIQSVVIEEGVTTIGDCAFYYLDLDSLVLPSGITEIGCDVFSGSLPAVTLPDSLELICAGAFNGAVGLRDVYYTGSEAQWNQISIASNNNENLLDNPNLTIHYNVADWGYCGGEGDGTNVTWVLDNDGTLTINGSGYVRYGAFQGRTDVKNVVFLDGTDHIGANMFAGCSNLESITIPYTSMEEIEVTSVADCDSLSVICYNGTPAQWDLMAVYYNEEVFGGSYAEYAQTMRAYIKSLVQFADTDWGYCGGEGDGTNLMWELSTDYTLTISGTGEMANYTSYQSRTTAPWGPYYLRLKTVVLQPGVTSIGDSAFYDCTSLESVTIPAGVLSIGDAAFRGCFALTSITIPDGVTSIPPSAFATCLALTSVMIPDSVTSIDAGAFSYCTALQDVYYGGSEAQWGEIQIDESGEYGNESLLNANIHYNVVDWGYCGAADNEENVTWVLANDGTMTISGEGAMANYHPRRTPWYAYTSSIKSVVAEDGVSSIGSSSFWSCGELASVALPDTLQHIGSEAFMHCLKLTEITLPADLRTIGPDALYNTGLSAITIPSSLERLGSNAVGSIDTVVLLCKNFTFSTDIEPFWNATIYGYADSEATMALAQFCTTCQFVPLCPTDYTHTVVDKAETAATETTVGHTAGWYCEDCGVWLSGEAIAPLADTWGYCGGEGDGTNLVWVLDSEGTLTISGEGAMADYTWDIGAPWRKYARHISSFDIQEGVTTIGDWAFQIIEADIIALPQGVTTIGEGGFCNHIKNAIMPVSVTRMEAYTFTESSVRNIFFAGSEEQWNQISLAEDHGLTDGINIHFNATGHTPGDPVRERIVPATCTEAGGYDEVVYCTQCPAEISRTHITVDPLNHRNAQNAPATEATATEHGHTAGVWCPDCETWLSGGDVIHNTLGAQTVIKEPTDTEEGLVDIVCTVCGEHGQYTAAKTEPKPDDNSGNDSGSSGGFWQRITSFAKGIIDWFLRLFKWFGK